MQLFIFQFRVSNSKVKNETLIFELVIRSETFKLFIFLLGVSNSKVEKQNLNLQISNLKFNLIFYEVELVTRKKNFLKTFWS